MDDQLDFGKTFEYKSYNDGRVTSVTKGLTRSIKIIDKFDAQAKLLEFYKLIESGKTKELTFVLHADDNYVPKRMEVTMITEKRHNQSSTKK